MRVVDRESLREVVRANPLLDVAAEHGVDLVELGPGLRAGRCPLCAAPVGRSLLVFVEDRRFRCLVCKHGGNVVGLVMGLENLPYLAAVRRLAERAGLDFDELFPEARTRLRRRPEVPLWALTPPAELS
jgi:DNA primase